MNHQKELYRNWFCYSCSQQWSAEWLPEEPHRALTKALGKGTRNPTRAHAMLGSRPDFLCQEQQPDNTLSARSQLPCRARQVRKADVSQVGPVWGIPWEVCVRSRWAMSSFTQTIAQMKGMGQSSLGFIYLYAQTFLCNTERKVPEVLK